MITEHIDHEDYIAKNAPDLRDQLATFRDREFGDITATYEGEFTVGTCAESRYSVEWTTGVRYSYYGRESACIAYIEGYMDGYGEGRR